MDGIRLLLFAAAPRYRNYGKSSGGIVVECDFKSRFDRGTKAPSARVQALSLSLSFFLRAPSAEHVIVSRRRGGGGRRGEKEEKKRAGAHRVCREGSGLSPPSLPPSVRFLPSLFAPSSYFSGRIFAGRQLARARAATGYQWSVALANCRRPVSICRSDYFVPPKRATVTAREPPPALSPAIRNFLPILLSRAAYAHCATRRAVMQYFARPSVSSGIARAQGVRPAAGWKGTGTGRERERGYVRMACPNAT